MNPSIEWGYWFGWFTAAILSGLEIVIFGAFAFSRDIICTGVEGEQCTREWLSALGGWIALVAAFPTVAILLMQVAEANRHHRDNAMMSLRRKRSICDRIIQLNDEYVKFVKGSEDSWINLTSPVVNQYESRGKSEVMSELVFLKVVVEVDQFQNFENEIDIPRVSAARLHGMITDAMKEVGREGDELMYPETGRVGHKIVRLYEQAELLHSDAARRAKEFLDDTNHLVPVRD